jgi:hypothetical protein
MLSNRSCRVLLASSASRLGSQSSRRGFSTPLRSEEDYYPNFSIGMGFDQFSDGIVAINECRNKYAAKFGLPNWSCTGKRLYYGFPLEHLNSCEEVVRDYCIQHSTIIMELGHLFVVAGGPRVPSLLRQLTKTDPLVELDIHLGNHFTPILEEMGSRIKRGGPLGIFSAQRSSQCQGNFTS